jgi:hypothetical protein
MKKIPSIYERDQQTHLVVDALVEGCEWVVAGEGVPTRKFDGTACLIRAGRLFKRFDAKKGKTPPPGFEPAQEPDLLTGHWPGWVPVGDGPDDRWHREARVLPGCGMDPEHPKDGTYELCGPKIQGNPEEFGGHVLVPHGLTVLKDCPSAEDFLSIRAYLDGRNIEGIVWHHADGRMAKIKTRDFGLRRGECRERK